MAIRCARIPPRPPCSPPPPVHTQAIHFCSHDVSDCVLCMQVATLYNLCKALQSFHVRGMVHCSLAPLTFSWFQGGQGWKVAACGDWAQAGMHVRSCYQLRYASPEVDETPPHMAYLHAVTVQCTCKDACPEQSHLEYALSKLSMLSTSSCSLLLRRSHCHTTFIVACGMSSF